MLNMKKIKIALIILSFFCLAPLTFTAQAFNDVPENHENYNAIKLLNSLKIVKGYEDGNFRPGSAINRVEALKILLEAANIKGEDSASDQSSLFRDTDPTAWYYPYVFLAKSKGIVNGNPDGTFAPSRQVNKVEFLKMMMLTNGVDLQAYQEGGSPFSDAPASEWYAPYMRYAKQFNIVSPNEQGQANPSAFLSRGEASEILYRFLLLQRGGEVQQLLSEAESLLNNAQFDVDSKKYTDAQLKVFQAVEKTAKAVTLSDQPIVQAAHLVSQSYEKTIRAYLLALEGKNDEARTSANEALSLADQAEEKSSAVKSITEKIRGFANNILSKLSANN